MLRRFATADDGVSLVEFALVTPVLILALVACLDFARALTAYVIVANASREGARYAMVHAAATETEIHTYLSGRVVPLDPSALQVRLTPPYAKTADPRWVAAGSAPGIVSVKVTYPWQSATAVVGSFFSAGGSRSFEFTSAVEAIR